MNIRVANTYLTPLQVKQMKMAIQPVDSKGKGGKPGGTKNDSSEFGRTTIIPTHPRFDQKI